MSKDFFGIEKELKTPLGTHKYYNLRELSKKDARVAKLPYSIRILLENAIRNYDAFAVTGVEMAAGAVLLSIPTFFKGIPIPDGRDAALLLVLAAGCTLLPFILWLQALRHVSAFTTQLLLNLEPIYAILLAAMFFQEYKELSFGFYLGATMVVFTILLQPWLRRLRGGKTQ